MQRPAESKESGMEQKNASLLFSSAYRAIQTACYLAISCNLLFVGFNLCAHVMQIYLIFIGCLIATAMVPQGFG